MPISKKQPVRPRGPLTDTQRGAAKKNRASLFFILLAVLLCTAGLFAYTKARLDFASAKPLDRAAAELALSAYRDSPSGKKANPYEDARELSAFRGAGTASPLPNDIHAPSAILVDAFTGAILYQKNADEKIPPASMTKLAAMYTAFRAVENGEITFDDIVKLPSETWAINIPPGSSLMFLGEGQTVTVRELLRGMAVASGNDAAIALALHISPTVEEFVARMNGEMEKLGLPLTRFAEPSGLSEFNSTTAREFADFSLVYVRSYPEALKAFHSLRKIEYPMPWNLSAGSQVQTITQYATNGLLGVLDGCDGLKTGFIYESGFNLSLTAERNGTRFIAVTMGGPGATSREGSAIRNEDGTTLIEWAFANFTTVRPEAIVPSTLTVWGGTVSALTSIPARTEAFTASLSAWDTAKNEKIVKNTEILPWLIAPIQAGDVVGTVYFTVGGEILHSVPLVADRSVEKGNGARVLLDYCARNLARLLK